jgi:hypothetical protein
VGIYGIGHCLKGSDLSSNFKVETKAFLSSLGNGRLLVMKDKAQQVSWFNGLNL